MEDLDSGSEIRHEIEADEYERAALAARLGLARLDSLSAEVALRRLPGGPLIGASGRLTADLVQNCVVTLAPLSGHVDEKFAETFAPEGYESGEDGDSDVPTEYFDGHEIDIGELAAQLLSLSLDPYPRAPDAAPAPPADGGVDRPGRRRPFGGLAGMFEKRR